MSHITKRNKKTGTSLLCLLLVLSFIGCGNNAALDEGAEPAPIENMDMTAQPDGRTDFPTEAPDASAAPWALVWADNGSDAYIATANTALILQEWEGLSSSSGNFFLNGSAGGRFQKFFFEDHTQDSEWIYLADSDGSYIWRELDAVEYGAPGMGLEVGGTALGGGYVVQALGVSSAQEAPRTKILLLDETFQLTGSFELEGLDYIGIQADASGNVAFVVQSEDGSRIYRMVDQNGRTVWERSYDAAEYRYVEWLPFPDGSLGLFASFYPSTYEESQEKGEVYSLLRPDLDSGGDSLIARTDEKTDLLYLCPFDQDTLLYANQQGLYLCSLNFEEEELIYRWSSHGISVKEIRRMSVLPGGEISCIYSSKEGDFYLYLKPNTGETDGIVEIPFVVSEMNRREYQEAIAEFNRKYPNYALTLVEYGDETALLTELNAGAGPVLIDTGVLSFGEYESLWEDLGDRLSQAGLSDVLLEKVMAVGQISGRQYGIVPSWQMLTFASASCDLESWSQQEFLDYLKSHPKLRMIHREQTPVGFIQEFFVQDLMSSSFVEWEAGRARFDSPDFVEAMELAGQYAIGSLVPNTRSEVISMMREGTCLGEEVYLLGPESIAYYDAMLGENADYIGFPGPDGSRHYINGARPLTIRASATEEQKRGAFLFLELLLSRETQESLVEGAREFSVRRDVFEEQLRTMSDQVDYEVDGERLTIEVDAAAVREKLLALYEGSVPYPYLPAGLSGVFSEELQSFFQGRKTAEAAAAVLQNRVQLYLDERN